MVTAQEVIVALRSEGAGEVAQDVESVTDNVEEASDQVEETGDEMEGFTAKFSNAAGAIIGSLALMGAGLLAQVPVIGEAAGALGAIVDAIAFQMDQVLRPVLGPVIDFFYNIAEAIFNAEGPLGDFIGIIGTVAAIVATAAGIMYTLGVSFASVVGAATSLIGGIGTLLGVIKALVVGLAGLVGWPVLVGAAIAALAFIFRDELAAAFDFVVDKAGDFVSGLMDKIPGIKNWISDVTDRFVSWASNLASDAIEWGKNIGSSIIEGLRNTISGIAETIRRIIDRIISTVKEFIPGASIDSAVDIGQSIGGSIAQGASNAAGQAGEFVANRFNVDSTVNVDGRDVGRATASERFDETSRRGTFN